MLICRLGRTLTVHCHIGSLENYSSCACLLHKEFDFIKDELIDNAEQLDRMLQESMKIKLG